MSPLRRCLLSSRLRALRRRQQAAPRRHPGQPERSAGDESRAQQRHQRDRILPRQKRGRESTSSPTAPACTCCARHLAGAGPPQAAEGAGVPGKCSLACNNTSGAWNRTRRFRSSRSHHRASGVVFMECRNRAGVTSGRGQAMDLQEKCLEVLRHEMIHVGNLKSSTRQPDMIFRQLFDSVSGTYSYLLASRARRRGDDPRSRAGKGRPLLPVAARARSQAGQGGRHPSACRPCHRVSASCATAPSASPSWASRARPTWCRCGSPTATR